MSKKLTFVVLAFLIALVPIGGAQAQGEQPPKPWTNTATQLRPDIGPAVSGLEPGTNGYKVFNPGAIKMVPAQSQNSTRDASVVAAATPYRRGSTDVWGSCCTWNFGGSHTSDSDLFEAEIWSNGYLKYKSDTGWKNSCRDQSSGVRAHCNTSFSGWYKKIYGETKHHFHTSGYVDNNMTTSDSY